MKIIKRQYGGPVYSPQGIQNIGGKVVKFIDNGGVKGWLERKKDKQFVEDFKKKNPSVEDVLNINSETGIRSEQPLINEDWLVASSVLPAFGGGLGIKSRLKAKKFYLPDRVVDGDHPNAINYIFDNHPDLVTNHSNKFWKFLDDEPNLVKGKTGTINYLKSDDYRNQLKKNFPNINDSEIEDIVNHHIDQINNSEVWVSEARNIDDWGVQGEFTPEVNGEHLIRIWNNSENPLNSRKNLNHEYLHATHGVPGKDSFHQALKDKKLLGEGLSRVYSKSGDIASTGDLGLDVIKKYDELTPEEWLFLNDYLVAPGKDEARVRALKLRDRVNFILEKERKTNPNITWDDAYKIVEEDFLNPKENLKRYGIYDIQQLFKYFTPESIKKYVQRVMTIGVPTGIILNENGNIPTKMQYGGPLPSAQGIQNVGEKVSKFLDDDGIKGWLERKRQKEFDERVKQMVIPFKSAQETGIEQPLVNEDWLVASSIIPAFGGGLGIKQMIKKKPKIQKMIDFDKKYVNDVPDRIITHNNTFLEQRFRETDLNLDRAYDDLEKYFLSEDYLNQLRKNFPGVSDQKLEAMVWEEIDNLYRPTVYSTDSPNILEPNIRGYYFQDTPHIEIYEYDKRTPNKNYINLMHELLHASRGTGRSKISRHLKDKGVWSTGKVYTSTTNVNGVKKVVDKSYTGLELKKRYKDYSPEERAFIDYLLDNDELRDRALNARRHMWQTGKSYAEFVSGSKSFDVEQLYQYFTPESVKEYIDKVFTIGIPAGIILNQTNNEQSTDNLIR